MSVCTQRPGEGTRTPSLGAGSLQSDSPDWTNAPNQGAISPTLLLFWLPLRHLLPLVIQFVKKLLPIPLLWVCKPDPRISLKKKKHFLINKNLPLTCASQDFHYLSVFLFSPFPPAACKLWCLPSAQPRLAFGAFLLCELHPLTLKCLPLRISTL